MSPLMVILIVLIVLVLLGGGWGYRSGWYAGAPHYGYGVSMLGVVLIIVLVVLLMGRW